MLNFFNLFDCKPQVRFDFAVKNLAAVVRGMDAAVSGVYRRLAGRDAGCDDL
jgi:hypothetical protein